MSAGAEDDVPDEIGVGAVTCPTCGTTLAVDASSRYLTSSEIVCPCGRHMEVIPDGNHT